jgi:hypothetical protein
VKPSLWTPKTFKRVAGPGAEMGVQVLVWEYHYRRPWDIHHTYLGPWQGNFFTCNLRHNRRKNAMTFSLMTFSIITFNRNFKNATLRIMTLHNDTHTVWYYDEHHYDECNLCWVSQIRLLCWESVCWVSICLMLLCWLLQRQRKAIIFNRIGLCLTNVDLS